MPRVNVFDMFANGSRNPLDYITLFDNYPHVDQAFYDYMFGNRSRNGSFINALFDAFLAADANNFGRLAMGFPVVAECIKGYSTGSGLNNFPKTKGGIDGDNDKPLF